MPLKTFQIVRKSIPFYIRANIIQTAVVGIKIPSPPSGTASSVGVLVLFFSTGKGITIKGTWYAANSWGKHFWSNLPIKL